MSLILTQPPEPNHSQPIDRRILVQQLAPDCWEVRELTSEERVLHFDRLSAATRVQRDKYLSSSDHHVLPDLWFSYNEGDRATWAAFRQALRDLPSQPGFPYDHEWPAHPQGSYE